MMLILGLGNPGTKYESSRHNVGFHVVESCAAFFQRRLKKRCFRLYRRARLKNGALLVQPLTYMNRSGEVLRYFSQYPISSMVVICDQMDLPPGTIRIRRGGSSAGHRGLADLINTLGSGEFIRIYVGIGRPEQGVSVIDHVLGRTEDPAIETSVRRASEALIRLINGASFEEVAGEFNGTASRGHT
jgi:PTH1 family peptidyl-tRNA hydrolase